MKKFRKFISLIITVGVMFLVCDNRLIIRKYYLKSNKVKGRAKFVLISDLHSCRYGKNQYKLIKKIDEIKPDAILMAGDILDDLMPQDAVFELLDGIKKYNCFYVTGNHEVKIGNLEKVKNIFKNYRVKVLDGKKEKLIIGNDEIDIFGIDDIKVGEANFINQFTEVNKSVETNNFSILISHRPEKLEYYECFKGDLIVTGHAHGGQWRLPFIMNGLIAPNQGLFPKYAGGLYQSIGGVENKNMVVSRGLAKENTILPRIFNRPEVIVIEVEN